MSSTAAFGLLAAAAAMCLLALALPQVAGGQASRPAVSTSAGSAELDVAAIVKLAAKAPRLAAALQDRGVPGLATSPVGQVARVADAAGLYEAVRQAQPGATILLADGTYPIDRLRIETDRLAIRGESGRREKVILDGGGKFSHVVTIRGAKDLLIADLTVANAGQYGVFFYGDSDVQRLKVYNVKFHNCYVRALKGTHAARINDSYTRSHPIEVVRKIRPAGGEVRYCLFVNDQVNPHERPYGGDYIGGIDVMWAKDWVIADNVFVNIRGRQGGGRGAIFVWVSSENILAERNVIVNCDRGICFGNPSGRGPHVTGGMIRNNFIAAGSSEGIELAQTRDVRVYNNTVYCQRPEQRAVQVHGGAEGAQYVNNLVRGRVDLPAEVAAKSNLTGELDGWFVRPDIGDLHLTAKARQALGGGKVLEEVPTDFDGQRRMVPPCIGADEHFEPQGTSQPASAPYR